MSPTPDNPYGSTSPGSTPRNPFPEGRQGASEEGLRHIASRILDTLPRDPRGDDILRSVEGERGAWSLIASGGERGDKDAQLHLGGLLTTAYRNLNAGMPRSEVVDRLADEMTLNPESLPKSKRSTGEVQARAAQAAQARKAQRRVQAAQRRVTRNAQVAGPSPTPLGRAAAESAATSAQAVRRDDDAQNEAARQAGVTRRQWDQMNALQRATAIKRGRESTAARDRDAALKDADVYHADPASGRTVRVSVPGSDYSREAADAHVHDTSHRVPEPAADYVDTGVGRMTRAQYDAMDWDAVEQAFDEAYGGNPNDDYAPDTQTITPKITGTDLGEIRNLSAIRQFDSHGRDMDDQNLEPEEQDQLDRRAASAEARSREIVASAPPELRDLVGRATGDDPDEAYAAQRELAGLVYESGSTADGRATRMASALDTERMRDRHEDAEQSLAAIDPDTADDLNNLASIRQAAAEDGWDAEKCRELESEYRGFVKGKLAPDQWDAAEALYSKAREGEYPVRALDGDGVFDLDNPDVDAAISDWAREGEDFATGDRAHEQEMSARGRSTDVAHALADGLGGVSTAESDPYAGEADPADAYAQDVADRIIDEHGAHSPQTRDRLVAAIREAADGARREPDSDRVLADVLYDEYPAMSPKLTDSFEGGELPEAWGLQEPGYGTVLANASHAYRPTPAKKFGRRKSEWQQRSLTAGAGGKWTDAAGVPPSAKRVAPSVIADAIGGRCINCGKALQDATRHGGYGPECSRKIGRR